MLKNKIIKNTLIVLTLSLLLTLIFGPLPHKYIHKFPGNTTHKYSSNNISPYEDTKNEEHLLKFNNMENTLISSSMKYDRDYLVLNGGGNTIVGLTRVFKMNKEDFKNISFEEYIKWTEENFAKYDCKTKEEYEKDILCHIKGYIIFEDNSAIKYIDGTTTYTKITESNFNYLNGFSQNIIQESRIQQNKEKPSFFYLNKETHNQIIGNKTTDTEIEFNTLKDYMFQK